MQFSTDQKYRICQIGFGAGFIVTLFWLCRLSGFAPSHDNRLVFTGLVITVVITVLFGLGFYYYRAKLRNVDADAAAIETLANAGKRSDDTDRNP